MVISVEKRVVKTYLVLNVKMVRVLVARAVTGGALLVHGD